MRDPLALRRALGEYLSEPKGHVSFEGPAQQASHGVLTLDRRTRMMYDAEHVFLNGESFLAAGRDAQLMRLLADQRTLSVADVKRLGSGARALLEDWCDAGWIHFGQ